jgi:hypothetical protein
MPPITSTPLIEIPQTVGTASGSVGNFISALLETAGLHLQGEILTTFQSLFHSAAYFLLIAAMIGVLLSFVLSGGYKLLPSFLLGTTLFMFVLETRTEVDPTQVQVGSRVATSSKEDQIKMLRLVGGDDAFDKKPSVSFVFRTFDRLVSSIIQTIVGFQMDTINGKDLEVQLRDDAMRFLFSQGSDRAEYRRLVGLSMGGPCGDFSRYAHEEVDRTVKEAQLRKTNRGTADDRKWFDAEADRIAQGKREIANRGVRLDSDLENYLSEINANQQPVLTCSDVWRATTIASFAEAQNLEAYAKEKFEAIAVPKEYEQFTRWEKVKGSVQNVLRDTDPQYRVELMAASILRHTLPVTPNELVTAQIIQNRPLSAQMLRGVELGTHAMFSGENTGLAYFAGMIPYLQGFMLFILAAAFPFFALFLLTPHKMKGFLIWFGLWFWVKSWDIGFALVHVVREYLWYFMSRKTLSPDLTNTTGLTGGLQLNWADPASVFRVMSEFDPIANMGTYTALVSILTLAIPVIMAYLVSGADTLISIFREPLDQYALRYAKAGRFPDIRRLATVAEAQLDKSTFDRELQGMKGRLDNPGTTSDGINRLYANPSDIRRNMQGASGPASIQNLYNARNNELAGYMANFQRKSKFFDKSKMFENSSASFNNELLEPTTVDYMSRMHQSPLTNAMANQLGNVFGKDLTDLFRSSKKSIDGGDDLVSLIKTKEQGFDGY